MFEDDIRGKSQIRREYEYGKYMKRVEAKIVSLYELSAKLRRSREFRLWVATRYGIDYVLEIETLREIQGIPFQQLSF